MGRPVVFFANRKTLFFVLQCTVAAWHNVVRSSQVWTSSKVPKFVIILPITVLGRISIPNFLEKTWKLDFFRPQFPLVVWVRPCRPAQYRAAAAAKEKKERAAAAKEQKKREQEAKVAKARKDPAGRVSARVSGCDFRWKPMERHGIFSQQKNTLFRSRPVVRGGMETWNNPAIWETNGCYCCFWQIP